MERTIAILNHKGGVGKTTSAVNIAACLGESGFKVLLIDIDPQGNATVHLGITNQGKEFLQALHQTDSLPTVELDVAGVTLVPSGPELALARQRFTGQLGAQLLPRCIERTLGEWDFIIIDCPPSMEVLTQNALQSSKHVIVPVEASFLGLSGIKQIVQTVDKMRLTCKELRIEAVIPCRAHPRRRIHREIMDTLEGIFPGKMTPVVRENVALAEAPSSGKPIIQYAPRSIGAEDYRAVTRWLVSHFKADRPPAPTA